MTYSQKERWNKEYVRSLREKLLTNGSPSTTKKDYEGGRFRSEQFQDVYKSLGRGTNRNTPEDSQKRVVLTR